ncbi:MAG: hypothetical protein QOG15_1717 [Solirubrobacteraceae bacterium]|jgi:GTP pyrophosphokinase|nr:hypothetical protein [Solirubrobacteraceae bacterium]
MTLPAAGSAELRVSSAAKAEDQLVLSALQFAARRHAGQRRSDGEQFIQHPLEVARLLRDAGCSSVVVAAGLLHDAVEDTRVGVSELREQFGEPVADIVSAVSDDPSIGSYRHRKQLLREQVRDAGEDAALVFAADKISEVRELPGQVARDRARVGDAPQGTRARTRLERYHQMRLEHYNESVRMLKERGGPDHQLVTRLARELEACRAAGGRREAGAQG